jgi:hypothetical protein
MKRSAARVLTVLYAPSWRSRYGEEFEILLAELPVTPALLGDVVSRAIASRAPLLGAIALVLLMLSIGGSHIFSSHRSAELVERIRPHATDAFLACRAYSSVSATGFAQRRQCLD